MNEQTTIAVDFADEEPSTTEELRRVYLELENVNGAVKELLLRLDGVYDEAYRKGILDAINIIEDYKIPVGNSSAGELACEWTYDALVSIRDDLRELVKET